MAKFDQFGSVAPGQGGNTRDCLNYEAMLAEVVDGTLSAEDQAAFDRHLETCDTCTEMLKDAQRGAAWLAMLKPYPPRPTPRAPDARRHPHARRSQVERHGRVERSDDAVLPAPLERARVVVVHTRAVDEVR